MINLRLQEWVTRGLAFLLLPQIDFFKGVAPERTLC